MFFFSRKSPSPNKSFYPDDNKVHLRWDHDSPASERIDERSFQLIPGEEVNSKNFCELAFSCLKRIFDDKQVVLNCLGISSIEMPIAEEPCVRQYMAQGGTPVFSQKHELYTISRGLDHQLVDNMPKDCYGCFYFEAYGYEPTESGGYNRCLTAHYYEDHQYLRICASSDIENYAEAVREVCNQYGKELCADSINQ